MILGTSVFTYHSADGLLKSILLRSTITWKTITYYFTCNQLFVRAALDNPFMPFIFRIGISTCTLRKIHLYIEWLKGKALYLTWVVLSAISWSPKKPTMHPFPQPYPFCAMHRKKCDSLPLVQNLILPSFHQCSFLWVFKVNTSYTEQKEVKTRMWSL